MKIGIQTWGSNGDARPLLALASGLTQAGHEITLLVSSLDNRSYQIECQALGINYWQVPEYIDFDLEDFAERALRMNSLQWLKALLEEAFFPSESEIYAAAQQLSLENDLLIGHHFLYPVKLAAKQAEKPFVSVTFCHAGIPVATEPPFGFPNLGSILNPISWQLMETVFNWTLKKPLSRLWLQAGYEMPARLLSEHLTSQTLNLVAIDPVFCPAHQLWPAHHQVCGFLDFTDDSDRWVLPASLSQFLAAGAPPVYMTFGSLQQAVPDWSMDLFLSAVALSGCRAIIQSSSARYPANSQKDQVYFIGRHPHQPVFKHCVAVVHHGGAGTTHAATRSGCPSVVVPFMDEQLFWAKQLQHLQLAAMPLPAKKVNAVKLAKGITTVLDNAELSFNAQQVSHAMQRQDGVNKAVQLVTQQLVKAKD